jgi:hypothetical protein
MGPEDAAVPDDGGQERILADEAEFINGELPGRAVFGTAVRKKARAD